MALANLERTLPDLYLAVDLAQLRQQLSRHLMDLGFWWITEHLNCLQVTDDYTNQGKYIWDNLSDHLGDRRSDLIDAIYAAFLSQGVEEQNSRLRWLARQTRPYLAFSDKVAGVRVHREFCKTLGDFGYRGPNTLVVPLPDGGAGRHRLWACAEDDSALRNSQQAVTLMIAYNHMKQLMEAGAFGCAGKPAMIGDTAPDGTQRDAMHRPVPARRTSALAQVRKSATRAHAVRAYIKDHLDDPELGVDQLCRTFAISRRTIYRMFAADGGIARHITERRLSRAFGELRVSSPSRGLINAVAMSCGFDDLARFCRLFRERFAFTPSDAVGLGSANGESALSGRDAANGDAQGSSPSVRA